MLRTPNGLSNEWLPRGKEDEPDARPGATSPESLMTPPPRRESNHVAVEVMRPSGTGSDRGLKSGTR